VGAVPIRALGKQPCEFPSSTFGVKTVEILLVGECDWNEGEFVESGVLIVAGGIENATEGVVIDGRLKFLADDGDVPAELAGVHGLELRPRSPGMRGFVIVVDGPGVLLPPQPRSAGVATIRDNVT
jgi:hypothetical protein